VALSGESGFSGKSVSGPEHGVAGWGDQARRSSGFRVLYDGQADGRREWKKLLAQECAAMTSALSSQEPMTSF